MVVVHKHLRGSMETEVCEKKRSIICFIPATKVATFLRKITHMRLRRQLNLNGHGVGFDRARSLRPVSGSDLGLGSLASSYALPADGPFPPSSSGTWQDTLTKARNQFLSKALAYWCPACRQATPTASES